MTTNKYVPTDEDMREAWRAFTGPNRDHGFDTWLARVRRDAAREALNGFAQEVDANGSWWPGTDPHSPRARAALNYRDTHYPEETP